MIVSFNELDAVVRKAFRGAGYHWGEAEEAGKAALWLAQNRLAPAALTLSLLQSADGNVDNLRPSPDWRSWASGGGAICPLLAGIALADSAASIVDGDSVGFASLHAPGFLLPFLAQLTRERGLVFRLSLPQNNAVVSARGVNISGPLEALAIRSPAQLLAAEQMPGTEEQVHARTHSTEISNGDWASLNDFAVKTYVPASDHSRLAGAGAGVVDTD